MTVGQTTIGIHFLIKKLHPPNQLSVLLAIILCVPTYIYIYTAEVNDVFIITLIYCKLT